MQLVYAYTECMHNIFEGKIIGKCWLGCEVNQVKILTIEGNTTVVKYCQNLIVNQFQIINRIFCQFEL